MVIHKNTGSVETRTGCPSENFGEYENVFIVDDKSELGKKIASIQTSIIPILDDDVNIIDATPKPNA